LRQAPVIWRVASEQNFAHFAKEGRKRKAIVHLDHLISDWQYMVRLNDKVSLKDLLNIIAGDTITEWEVHCYTYLGWRKMPVGWDYWVMLLRVVAQLKWLRENFKEFPGIKLVPELYGELDYELENGGFLSQSITPSSTLWPSWPENVPWRVCPTVRSDEAVIDVPTTDWDGYKSDLELQWL
jgi:hypothetical protein